MIDGGSTDGTVALIREYAGRDARIRLIDATPVPDDWNGKAWNLQRGLDGDVSTTPWVLTIDADVRPRSGLAAALVARATGDGLTVLSGATRQRLSGPAEGLVHPALLTSLVYRYGIPGATTTDPDDVQANGQCMLIRRAAIDGIGGFRDGRHSLCEDVTVARKLAASGHRIGFAESGDLVDVAMYGGARDAWANWPRSLTMRDQFSGHAVAVRLAEVALVQGLPVLVTALTVALRRRHRYPKPGRGRGKSGRAGTESCGSVRGTSQPGAGRAAARHPGGNGAGLPAPAVDLLALAPSGWAGRAAIDPVVAPANPHLAGPSDQESLTRTVPPSVTSVALS